MALPPLAWGSPKHPISKEGHTRESDKEPSQIQPSRCGDYCALPLNYGGCYAAEMMIAMMSVEFVPGQEVTLGGYPDQWVLVDDQSAGFWTEARLVRHARWPS
ncbi:MAG: hypothetical protein NVS9B1_07480 [Candidatus Dormibacteraceae bacterium]